MMIFSPHLYTILSVVLWTIPNFWQDHCKTNNLSNGFFGRFCSRNNHAGVNGVFFASLAYIAVCAILHRRQSMSFNKSAIRKEQLICHYEKPGASVKQAIPATFGSVVLAALIVTSIVATIGLTVAPSASGATMLGANGKILFVSNRDDANVSDIFVMNPDGSELTKLTNDTLSTFSALPQWSPDGTKIAFVGRAIGGGPSSQEIFVMNADGTETRQLTNVNSLIYDHRWSPDGSKIVFGSAKDASSQTYNVQIYAVNVEGNNDGQINLSNDY